MGGVLTPEGRVKRNIRAYLDEIGAYVFMPVQMGYGQKTLDYLCCVPTLVTPAMVGRRIGVFVAPEAKAPGKEATKFQLLTIADVQRAGGISFVAYGANDVQQALVGAGLK